MEINKGIEKGVEAYVANPIDRIIANFVLKRSQKVGRHLAGALRIGEVLDAFSGVNRIRVDCMDPRNITGIKQDLGVKVVKAGGAVASTREIQVGGKQVTIPDSDFFAGLLQSVASDKRETVLIASPHFGKVPCGYMHKLEAQMHSEGRPDLYSGDRVSHNLDLIAEKTVEPATNIFNLQLETQKLKPIKRLGVRLPWNTDKASLVLSYGFNDPGATLMVADLVAKYAAVFEAEFGLSGQFLLMAKDITRNGEMWVQRDRMIRKLVDGKGFEGFQDDIRRWQGDSAECAGLTDAQNFGLLTQIADNAALIYGMDTHIRRFPKFAEFFPHQIFMSINGVSLNEKDPNASRLSASPLNGEDIGEVIVAMTKLSFEKAELMQEVNKTHRGVHRFLELPPTRVAFLSFGVDADDKNDVAALFLLGKAMRTVRANSHVRELIESGKLAVVPVIIDSKTSAALSVPILY